MKVRRQAAAALMAASATAQTPSAYVQPTTSSTPLPVSYTTMTVDDYPSASLETLITVTQGLTITYCPECEMSGGPTGMPTSKPPGHTTVYTTTYLSLCSTGTVPVTYTVTESCDEPTPTWTSGPSRVPNGFTVSVKQCTVCDKTPVPVTITEPCDCEATSGTSVGPKPTGTPIQQISNGQIREPGPSPTGGCDGESCGSSGSGSPSPTGGSSTPGEGCDGESCGGSGSGSPSSPGSMSPAPSSGTSSAPPYPTTTAAPQCPGPECRAKTTGGMDSFPIGNTSNITPYEGMATTSQIGFLTSFVLAIAVGALAFAL